MYMRVLFSFLLYLSLGSCSFAGIEIIFFDVGQGNCTLIKCPNGPPLLIDAGSSQGRGEDDVKRIAKQKRNAFKIKQIGEIALKIKDFQPPNLDHPRLNIIVSHADKDHINWIKDITDRFYLEGNPLKIKFLLGGQKEDYTKKEGKELIEYIKERIKKHPSFYKYSFFSKFESTKGLSKLKYGDVEVSILSRLPSTENTNTNSIVLKVTYGKLSAIITGDATGETTRHILSRAKRRENTLKIIEEAKKELSNSVVPEIFNLVMSQIPTHNHNGYVAEASEEAEPSTNNSDSHKEIRLNIVEELDFFLDKLTKKLNVEEGELSYESLQTNILQASHHGAFEEGCNNTEWIQSTNPEFIIFSAGTIPHFAHPRYEIADRAQTVAKRLRKGLDSHHFHCGKYASSGEDGKDGFKFLKDAEAPFSIIETTHGLYNTTNHGNIIFKWEFDSVTLGKPTKD